MVVTLCVCLCVCGIPTVSACLMDLKRSKMLLRVNYNVLGDFDLWICKITLHSRVTSGLLTSEACSQSL